MLDSFVPPGPFLPSPRLVSSIESSPVFLVFKCPPSCQPRQFSTSKAVRLCMCCNRGHEIEKVKDNLGTSVRVYADGHECCKGISSHVGVYRASAMSTQSPTPIYLLLQRGTAHTPPRSPRRLVICSSTISSHYRAPGNSQSRRHTARSTPTMGSVSLSSCSRSSP
jgi:hypothetical protein